MTIADLNDIPADQEIKIDAEIVRLFRAAGCDPGCHCCLRSIEVGDVFQLATNDGRDVMLCDQCDVDDLIAAKKKRARARSRHVQKYGYTRPSKPNR